MKKLLTSPFFTPVFFTITWLLFMCVLFIFGHDNLAYILEDHGPLEEITHFSYIPLFIVFALFAKFFLSNKEKRIDFILYCTLGITALLREMGVQHWLASKDTTAFKSRFFLSPNNPLSEKIIAGLILIVLAIILIYLAKKYAKHLIFSFFKMNPTSRSIATLCVFGVFGKFIDRFPANYKRSHGFPLPEQLQVNLKIIEETSETMLPWIAAFIIFQYWLSKRKQQN